MIEWALLALWIIIIVPIIVYLSVKSGTVGYYKGKKFSEKNEIEEQANNYQEE